MSECEFVGYTPEWDIVGYIPEWDIQPWASQWMYFTVEVVINVAEFQFLGEFQSV